MTERLCKNCEFFEFVKGGFSECRRRSPQRYWKDPSDKAGNVMMIFPPTTPDAWCGEFQVKPREQGGKDDQHS